MSAHHWLGLLSAIRQKTAELRPFADMASGPHLARLVEAVTAGKTPSSDVQAQDFIPQGLAAVVSPRCQVRRRAAGGAE